MRQGLSFDSFPATLYEKYGKNYGVCTDVLYGWIERYPEFSAAKKIADALCLKFWEQLGRQGVAGQLRRVSREIVHPDGRREMEYEPAPFAQGAWAFNMKNRFGWRDKHDIESRNVMTFADWISSQTNEEATDSEEA